MVPFPPPPLFFRVKYTPQYVRKSKGVQVAEPPDQGFRTEGPWGGGGSGVQPPNERHKSVSPSVSRLVQIHNSWNFLVLQLNPLYSIYFFLSFKLCYILSLRYRMSHTKFQTLNNFFHWSTPKYILTSKDSVITGIKSSLCNEIIPIKSVQRLNSIIIQ